MLGILLCNLGTPENPTPAAVKKYLAEFLMDPYVIDIPYPLRWLLIHGIILRTRPKKSAAAYAKVWTDKGSPLMVHSLALLEKLEKKYKGQKKSHCFALGMRYGKPSIAKALQELLAKGATKIVFVPLYPQNANASVRTALENYEQALERLQKNSDHKKIESQIVAPFYNHPAYIRATADLIRPHLPDFDHLLLSYHGLPERQIKKTNPDCSQHCLKPMCCDQITTQNTQCYKAQCYETSRLIAKELGLKKYSVAFQSRLGRTPWIQPFTDHLYRELPAQGVRKLLVASPSFVADCLETLEEIQIRGQEDFIKAGGSQLKLVPCLNASEAWIEALQEIISSCVFEGDS
jgi:protoporphyrin/coproporphyrin ferrochelatase